MVDRSRIESVADVVLFNDFFITILIDQNDFQLFVAIGMFSKEVLNVSESIGIQDHHGVAFSKNCSKVTFVDLVQAIGQAIDICFNDINILVLAIVVD